MFGFFKSDKKNIKGEIALILDVGSASLAASFVELNRDGEPKIIYVKRLPIKFLDDLSGSRFKSEMFKTLDLVLSDLNKNGLTHLGQNSPEKNVKRTYCSLASPWFMSETKTIKIKKDKPIVVTESFISDIIKKEEEQFEKDNYSADTENSNESEIIERKIVDIKLNGYKLEKPFGKKAQEIEITFLISISQTSILDEIEDKLLKHFHINELIFHSFTLASFGAIRDMYNRVTDFILLDITGEVTDVSLVREANVLKTMSFPVGKNTLLRSLSKDLKTSSAEALSSIKLLNAGKLDSQKSEKLEKLLYTAGEEWLNGFRKSITNLAENRMVPSTIFFTADEDLSNYYSKIIKSEKFSQSVMTDGVFIVSFVNCSSLDSYVSFRTMNEKDTFIAVEAIFFNKVFELEG